MENKAVLLFIGSLVAAAGIALILNKPKASTTTTPSPYATPFYGGADFYA